MGYFLESYHQQCAQWDNFDHQVEIFSGEKFNYHQIGNAYLQNEIFAGIDAPILLVVF